MKKKIMALCVCLCMLAIAIVGGTMAYFTDEQAQTNTFTAGKVDIILYESKVVKDTDSTSPTFGDLIVEKDANGKAMLTQKDQSYHLYPAMTVAKDPTIRVEAGSEDAWVAAKVIIKGDLYPLIGVAGCDNIDITQIADGGLMEQDSEQKTNWNGLPLVYETGSCVIYQDASKAADKTWTMYIFVKEAKAAKSTVTLFTELNIKDKWNNVEMAKINNMSIKVEAYATQTNGFADCYTAVTTAFPSAFDFN